MKVTEHVEHLLREGRKPKELVELGFPKRVVTRVRRQLKEEKPVPQSRAKKGSTGVTPLVQTTPVQPRLESLERKVEQLENRLDELETLIDAVEEINTHLHGTPDFGLKNRFKCDCGSSGYVALHIKCTKCGRETWWGWHPQ
jgi:hypothetical protein